MTAEKVDGSVRTKCFYQPDATFETNVIGMKKLLERTGWQPRIGLDEGLDMCIARCARSAS